MSGQEAGSSKDKSNAPLKTRNYEEVREDTNLSKGENSQIGGCDSPQLMENVCPKHKAHEYLTSHKIFELNNYLISHLLIDEPDNPIQYLADLIEKCLLFKTGQGPPPLIFTDRKKCMINGLEEIIGKNSK
ncbi:uncharacterized protein LOC141532073 [Cotesia typhae]|uniref:uncharacterized protein LOC141532073 n=1 Tax=Cotesia typhae TaxID=2053667 RepID=UPI003D69239E